MLPFRMPDSVVAMLRKKYGGFFQEVIGSLRFYVVFVSLFRMPDGKVLFPFKKK